MSSSTNTTKFDFTKCKDYLDIYPDICSYDKSFYGYRLSIAANGLFLGLFSLSLLGYIIVFLLTRFRNVGFTVALSLGVICEILGYLGRVMSWENQWADNPFLVQISCLTIGPAFISAAAYLCLRSLVLAFGPENSRLRPELYPRIFIPCDVVSLILQAVGGAMASIASHNDGDINPGNNTMIAGLASQVFTLLVFMGISGDFALRTIRNPNHLNQDPVMVRLRARSSFRLFIGSLCLSTICIFTRSVFRVAELSGGWTGPIMKRQDLFIGFEGAMVIIAVLVLNVFHPNLCFKGMERFRKSGAGSNSDFGKRGGSSGQSSGDEQK